MSLVHRSQLTHYFSPSGAHLNNFFANVATIFNRQQFTDLILIAGKSSGKRVVKNHGKKAKRRKTCDEDDEGQVEENGEKEDVEEEEEEEDEDEEVEEIDDGGNDLAAFGTHQMILASSSSFLRDLINSASEGCSCDAITICLPDFDEKTVKNLLSILYTGTSMGDCSASELKSLLNTLGIDLSKLSNRNYKERNQAFPDSRRSMNAVNQMQNNSSESVKMPLRSPALGKVHDESNEMLEVTPEVDMFLGNHFLAPEENVKNNGLRGRRGSDMGRGRSDDNSFDDKSDSSRDQNYSEQKRHNFHDNSDSLMESLGGESNGIGSLPDSSLPTSFGGNNGDGEDVKTNYLCRLCGKVSGNGASLFAHLLYPHYAHLWREEIPHRSQRYDCKKCSYSTVKRQHFVMHVARVHDELRNKLAALGENLEVLDNLTQRSAGGSGKTERIISNIAKGVNENEYSYGGVKAEDGDGDMDKTKEFLGGNDSMDDLHQPQKMFAYEHQNQQHTPQQHHQQPPQHFNRMPRGSSKPFVKCRLCGKSWKGKDNFFTHLVSTHFKYLWAKEVPKHADMFHCHVRGCTYQSKYRYNFLFHLAGKHKQLRQKLAEEGIPQNVLVPIETDGNELGESNDQNNAGLFSGMSGALVNPSELLRQSKMLLQQQQRQMTPPSALKTPASPQRSAGSNSSSQNNTRLICRVCSKISLNHTCHRQHVVGKHFYDFWAHLTADGMGVFNCHHPECTYKTPNRSVFIIHLAYVHQELRNKLIASGKDPNCATPDVFGKRKYRRSFYDSPMAGTSTQGQFESPPVEDQESTPSSSADESYKCSVCKTIFPRYRAVVEHLALSHFHHVWDENSGGLFTVAMSGPYDCQHCPFSSGSRQSFISHIVSQHDALKHVLAIQFEGQKTIADLVEAVASEGGVGDSKEEGTGENNEEDEEEEVEDDEMEEDEEEVEGQSDGEEYSEMDLATLAAAANNPMVREMQMPPNNMQW